MITINWKKKMKEMIAEVAEKLEYVHSSSNLLDEEELLKQLAA